MLHLLISQAKIITKDNLWAYIVDAFTETKNAKMIRVTERAKKLLQIAIVGSIEALLSFVYNEEKCGRRERERNVIKLEEGYEEICLIYIGK